MDFEIHLCIPGNSQQGHMIASLAAQEHITPSQAVEKIIVEVAKKHQPVETEDTDIGTIVAEAVRKAGQVREDRLKEFSALSNRNESASQLIGFLKDEPELVESIREASRERRQAMYGD